MTLKTCIPLLAALVLPGMMSAAFFAAEKNPPMAAVDPQFAFVADNHEIRLHNAVWDGNDIVVSASYAVPVETSANIQFGIDEQRTGSYTMMDLPLDQPISGRGAFRCRIPISDLYRTFDKKKPISVSIMLMPSVHGDRWSPLASAMTTLDPPWADKALTLAWSDTPLEQALMDAARQSEATIKLIDPKQRAKAIPVTAVFRNAPLSDVIDFLALASNARSRLLTTDSTGYEFSLDTGIVSPTTNEQKASVRANEIRIVQARWQGKLLAVDIDYHFDAAVATMLSFGFERLGNREFVIFDSKSDLPGSRFSGKYLLDPAVLDLSPSDYGRTCSISALLFSAEKNILASTKYLVPPQSQCLPVHADFHNMPLVEVLRILGERSGVKIILDDPQHLAETTLLTLKTPELPLIDLLAMIERLTGTIIHGSDSILIATIPGRIQGKKSEFP